MRGFRQVRVGREWPAEPPHTWHGIRSLFFPRVRTPCGRSAQVIIERKGTQHDDGEKNTSKPQKANKTNQNKNPKPKPPKAGGRFPIIQTVFPLYGGETGRKVGCVLSMGLNSLRKSVKRVSARAKSKRSQTKGLRSIINTVTTRPLHQVAKRGI